MAALDKGNKNVIMYIVNRIRRIRKSMDSTLAKVIQGDTTAVEKALRALLLCSWEGSIVKFLDEKEQTKIEMNDSLFKRFILQNMDWIDPNMQVLVVEGDGDSIIAAATSFTIKAQGT